jgi:hypothetical protein
MPVAPLTTRKPIWKGKTFGRIGASLGGSLLIVTLKIVEPNMELFKDRKRYKDFYHKVWLDNGEESKNEKIDSNELFFRMTGWEKEFRDLFGGKVLTVRIPHDGWVGEFGWCQQ